MQTLAVAWAGGADSAAAAPAGNETMAGRSADKMLDQLEWTAKAMRAAR